MLDWRGFGEGPLRLCTARASLKPLVDNLLPWLFDPVTANPVFDGPISRDAMRDESRAPVEALRKCESNWLRAFIKRKYASGELRGHTSRWVSFEETYVISFVINAEGRVTSSTIEDPSEDKKTARCIAKAVRGWTFEPPVEPLETRVVFPLTLRYDGWG